MSAVTWGNNTVHNIGGAIPSPAPVNFGFGTTSVPTVASPGGSLFGMPVPTSTGAFNVAAQPQQQYVSQQQIPAQAAMQAKMSAERVVETERIKNKLEKLYRIYTGTYAVPEDGDVSAKFCSIVYNDLTPEELQVRMIHGMTTGYSHHQGSFPRSDDNLQQQQPIFRPPRPNQITGRDWEKAIVENPDPNKYVPKPITGAMALQARLANQQNRAKEYAKNAVNLQKNLEFIRQREALARQELMEKDRQYAQLRRRLLELMKKVEVARCINQPLQRDEHLCLQRLKNLLSHVEQLRAAFRTLQNHAKTQIVSGISGGSSTTGNSSDLLGVPKKELLSVLTEQRRKLEIMTNTARRDLLDVDLVRRRVAATVPTSFPPDI